MSHPLATLAVGASDVINAKHAALDHSKRVATLDDRMVGSMLAAEVFAHAKMAQNPWRVFALRLFNLTNEGRDAFINAIKKEKGGLTRGQTEYGIDEKTAKKRTASFTVQVSELGMIAKAWNAGATITGWREYVNLTLPAHGRITTDAEVLEHGNYRTLVEYARTVAGAKGRGRPAMGFVEKLGKYLEMNSPAEDDTEGQRAYEQVVALFNSLKG